MKLLVRLSAYTRLEWSGVVDVPDTVKEEDWQDVVNAAYEEADGGDYEEDAHYWEKGDGWADEVPPDTPAQFSVTKDEDGTLVFAPVEKA